MKKTLVRTMLLAFLLIAAALPALAQGAAKVEPVFPTTAPGLIYLEGEDAVSTNFAREASLDYASSGLRVLQLNQGPQAAGAPFFAEYAFVVDQAGDYEFWLGGTPPGAQDELAPAYVSPFQYQIDGGKAVAVYREQMKVVDNYSITNFWSVLKTPLKLTAGIHTLRIGISEKRRYDLRYYFAIDALFLLKTGIKDLPAEALPAKFPAKRDNTSLDNPYHSLAVYETQIQTQPKQLAVYLELAKVYSLVGDYSNALKVLNRARINLGDSPETTLLMAKNRIWSGEPEEGLRLYRDYLKLNPQDLAIWAEAAKVFAWLGQYPASLELFQEALKQFPDELNLLVNEGLTLLWANRVAEGESLLDRAWEIARSDEASTRQLGSIYLVNGYPDKTVETWKKAIAAHPESLEFMLLLQDTLLRLGKNSEAQKVAETIAGTFKPSERLSAWLETATLKATIKQNVLDAYRTRLNANPDDLKLRDELVKAYFWNGRREEAIKESHNILVNKLYRQFQALETELKPDYQSLDSAYLQSDWLAGAEALFTAASKNLQQALEQWRLADAQVRELEKSGKNPEKLPAAQDALALAGQKLAEQTDQSRELLRLAGVSATTVAALQPLAEAAQLKALDDSKNLAQRKPWFWDRSATLEELGSASAAGNFLADWVLARISLFEQKPQLARNSLYRLQLLENKPASFDQLRAQAAIWTGPFTALDTASQGDLGPAAIQSTVFGENSAADARSALTDLAALIKDLPQRQAAVQRVIAMFHQHLTARMQIQIYQHDLDTFDQRSQLGDYYLSLNQFALARAQLEQVLRVAPGNITARFNLGRSRQLSGDWSGAMALYKEVWQSDPKYENTASLFNQLAKSHADRLDSSVATLWDNARTSTRTHIGFQAGGSTTLGLEGGYTLDSVRLIKSIGLNDPVTIALHTLDLSFPVSLPEIGLQIYGKLGGTLKDKHASAYFPADTIPAMSDFFDYLVVAPVLGAGLSWTSGPLTLKANYGFDQIPDSFFPLRTTSYEHRGDLSATLFFTIKDSPLFRSIGSRSQARIASVFTPFDPATNLPWTVAPPQGNLLWGASQDLTLNFLLASSPWTILVVNGNASWEDSTNPAEAAYYAPNQVLSAKGGLQLASWIGLGEGWVIGLSLRGNAGANDSPANTPSRTLFQFDAGLRTELSKGDLAVYLDLSANRASVDTTESYWAINLNLGLNLAVPAYIVP